jgi:hypothetical protein
MEFDAVISGTDPCMVSVGSGPCVLLMAYPDDDELIMASVGFDPPDCCRGGGMPRGEPGTVRMLQAALRFAIGELPNRANSYAVLMDVSSRKPSGDRASERCALSCSDVHILKDPEMRSWYEKHLGARVDPSKAGALAAIREALAAPIRCPETAFVKACARGAKLAGARAWLQHPGRQDAILQAFREAASWGALARQMIAQLMPEYDESDDEYGDGPDCPLVLKLLASILGSSDVCPGWASSHGWTWTISADAVAAYPVDVTWSRA